MFNREVVSYMTVTHKFKGIRMTSNKMSSVNWELCVNLAGVTKEDVDDVEQQRKIAVAFQKVSIWLDYFVEDVILVDSAEEDDCNMLWERDYDNTIIQIPGITDNIFLEALHAKVSTLAGDDLMIGEASLKGSDHNSTFHFSNIVGNAYALPEQDDWIDSEVAIFDKPWWYRDDCDTWEPAMEEGANREEILKEVDTSSALRDLVRDIEVSFGMHAEEETEAEIIKPKWKPKPV